ncbi:MAG: hypothetical protein P8J79_13850, partial [Halioglobus sp.]|nr:hypothetical protein [Halioglobus sp.]
MLTDKQIRQTIRQYVDEAGEQFSDSHLQSPPRNHADREGGIDFLEDQVAGLHSALANSNYTGKQYVYDAESFSGDIQAEVCSLFGLDATKVDRGDIQFLRACQAWTAATKQLYEDHLKRLHGEVVEPKRASVTSEIPKAPKAPLVSEVIEPFLSDRSKRKDIEERTASGYRQFVQLFIDIMGDVPVTSVTPAMAVQWRDKLLEYPKNKTKVKAYRDFTPKQLLSMDIPSEHCLSKATVNNHLVHLSTVFGDLVRLQTIPINPFTGHELKTTQQSYNQFTPSELDLIFTSPVYMTNSANSTGWKRTQSYWWLLPLALFTGCRAGELAQLRLDDVAMVDEVLTANIVE